MAETYEPISTTTLSTSATSIEFSSIPSTYTDLVIVYALKAATASADMYLRVNNDTNANYSNTILWGNGSTAGSNRFSSQPQIRLNYTVDVLTTNLTYLICNINNYSNTTSYKSIIYKTGIASDAVDTGASLWRSTSAINRVTLTLSSGNWGSGCTATLYGIKAA